jgi:hypothetical protein
LADSTREFGYEYTVALCAAIEAAISERDRTSFIYRGADLSHVVERELFIRLVNDDELYAAFFMRAKEARTAKPASTLGGSELGVRVARHLLGEREPLTRAAAARLRQAADGVRFLIRAFVERHEQSPRRADGGSTTCFVLDHAKLLRFIEPLTQRLERDDVFVISCAEDLSTALAGTGFAYTSYDHGKGHDPVGRAIGSALKEYVSLLAGYDALWKVLHDRRPRCVVVVEGMSPTDELANQVCRSLGIPCVCIQQGWSPIIHNGFRHASFTRMAVWGEGFREILAPYSPQQEFAISGSLAFATASVDHSKQLTDGRPSAAFFLQPPSPLIGEDHLRQVTDLISRASTRFPGATLLVREHPGWPLSSAELESLGRLPNVQLAPAEAYPLVDVIHQSRVAISIYSTSLLEAAALGTPALVFNPTSMPRYFPDVEVLGVGIETDRADAALDTINRLLHDDSYRESFTPAMARFRERFFADADERAPGRLIELLEELGRDT